MRLGNTGESVNKTGKRHFVGESEWDPAREYLNIVAVVMFIISCARDKFALFYELRYDACGEGAMCTILSVLLPVICCDCGAIERWCSSHLLIKGRCTHSVSSYCSMQR